MNDVIVKEIDERFTLKELEVFKFVHDFIKQVGYGQITIDFHNHDIAQFNMIQSRIRPTGGTADMDFVTKLMSTGLFSKDVDK